LAARRPVVADSNRKLPDEERLEKGPAYGTAADGGSEGREAWPVYRHDPLRSGVADTVLPSKLSRAWRTEVGGKLTQLVVAGGKVLLAGVDRHTVVALDERNGEIVWRYVAGGRIDSPPATYRGLALFGSADGWVTCLRLRDGERVWRFQAAPADVRAVALDQVESLWPVHGSVLILNGVAYCSAGRSTWLDGGIDLYGLEPATGKVVYKTRYKTRHPKYQEGKDKARPEHVTKVGQTTTDYKTFLASDHSDSFSMAGGAISDVLVSDGENVYLHHVKFNAKLERQRVLSRHLFSTSSLLDDTENHRSHWVLGTGDFSRVPVAYSWVANRRWRRGVALAVPAGVTLVYDDNAVWGVRRKGDATGKYELFEKPNQAFSPAEPSVPDFRNIPKAEADACTWKVDLPVRVRAMLKSGDRLYLGAMPVAVPPDDPHAAYEGRRGGVIWVVSAKDGTKIAEHKLDAPVVWDALAAANGRLFFTTTDGSVHCLAEAR